ncbi:MAG: dihydroxy-acid dehydratase [Rhodospirillales bacterium]|nr:dihydroxy-acid dehydratase [Rhodospirillales bacterium]
MPTDPISANTARNIEFADLMIEEDFNPYRTCIQGLANEPCTVQALLRRAADLLADEGGGDGLADVTQAAIVERLAANRPRVAVIQGSPDHPAHLLDHEHMLRAAARIWFNGGVPFTFGIPVICDGTAQSNIGQSYSLASRNHTAMAININFEGHSYHAAYVLSGCDKSPTGILSGLAAADLARRSPGRGAAPVWALFAPAHVLRGGEIPADTLRRIEALQDRARAGGEDDLAADLAENCKYILQCASDEAFLGQFNRAIDAGLMDRQEADGILDQLAAATCHDDGGVCAFNGTGNSSRTLVSALGFAPFEVELLTGAPETEIVNGAVDQLFRAFNKPELSVLNILERNYANAVRIHNATGSSTNLMLHMPAVMRHGGFDVSVHDYVRVQESHPVPDIFAHDLKCGRDTFVLARQAEDGHHRGMESLYKSLVDLGVPMDLEAPTITGKTWGERIHGMNRAVSPDLPEQQRVIRDQPVRDISGTSVLSGNFFSSGVIKVASMSDEQLRRFDGRVFVVRYYENEQECSTEMQAGDLSAVLSTMDGLDEPLLRAVREANGGDGPGDFDAMIAEGSLAFAFVIGGQGPKAFGMPEMFAPSQYLRHHGVLERTSILMTDGRYSGVTKGACIGHVTPEAFEGGDIGALVNGDVLWVRLEQNRIDILDRDAFLTGEKRALKRLPTDDRQDLIAERITRMEERQLQVAACSVMDHVTDAEHGVVPESVDRRATRKLVLPA